MNVTYFILACVELNLQLQLFRLRDAVCVKRRSSAARKLQ